MKTVWKLLLAVVVLGAGGAASYDPAMQYWKRRNRVEWETVTVTRGDLTRYVNSTGTIKPVLSVSVGSFVSGPIVELNVDFNDEVAAGEILARVDPRLFNAGVERDEATLATRLADVERIEAQLQQSLNNFKRGERLRGSNADFISDREMDALVFEVKSLQAQRKLGKASILQAQASLDTSLANLNYCEITSPVDGVVIDRKIDPGQTLAAQFQTPELFIVAPDLRKKVHVFASVDEADIGLVQKAKADGRPVTFGVDAHPDEVFTGEIEQIRVSSISNQNVVTYPVVIAATNPDMKLLPGMTASISFEVDSCVDTIQIPRSALDFYPEIEFVRESDRGLLDGSTWKAENKQNDDDNELDAASKAKARKERNKLHVWVVQGEQLRAIEIYTGLSEYRFTQLLSGELSEGEKLVIGRKDK